MKISKYVFTFFLFILTHSAFVQESQFTQKDIDEIVFSWVTREKVDNFKKILDSNTTFNGWTKYYTLVSYFYLRKGQNDSATYYSNKAIEFYETKEFGIKTAEEVLSKAYYIKGLREYFDGKKLTSLESLYKAFSIAEKYPKEGFLSWKFFILERISIINRDIGDYEMSLKYKKEMLKLKHIMERNYEGGNTYMSLGTTYYYLNRLDSARYYLNKSFKHYDDTTKLIGRNYRKDDVLLNKVSAYNNIGDILMSQQKKDSAVQFYRKAIKMYTENDLLNKSQSTKTDFYIWRNKIYLDYFVDQNIARAKKELALLLDSINKINNYDRVELELKKKVFELSRDIFKTEKKYNSVIRILDQNARYKENYFKNSYLKQQSLIAQEFNLEQKEKTINDLTTITETQKKVLLQKTIINWGLGLLILGIFAIAILMYRQKKIENLYKQANLEQRLLRSQLNPHFIFNSLSSATSLIEQNSKKLIPYLNKFNHLLRIILESSRNEFVYLSEEIVALELYFDLQSDFQQKFSYEIHVDDKIDKDQINIPPMFIQPCVENSIIHGLQGNKDDKIIVQVTLDEKSHLIHIEIRDNGIGYSHSKMQQKKYTNNSNSLSGKILEERLKIYSKSHKVKAKIEISEISHKAGTKVLISLPYVLG